MVRMERLTGARVIVAAAFVVLLSGCSRMLHSEFTVGTHPVVLDGCVSSSKVDGPTVHVNGSTITDPGTTITCDRVTLKFKDEQLTVDGRPTTTRQPNDRINVREHKVYVNDAVPGQ